MIFNQDRREMRQFFIEAWHKYIAQLPLQPLERVIADTVLEHPEYHKFLENNDAVLEQEYFPELGQTNPFLHMGLHIAIQEQLTTNRPAGIVQIYQALVTKLQNAHEVEHLMLECLGQMFWRAQRDGTPPDEAAYLECLKKLVRNV